MLDLSQFSQENLRIIQQVLSLVLDEYELHGENRLVGSTIPIEKFQKEGLSRRDVVAIFYKLEPSKFISLMQASYDSDARGFYPPRTESAIAEFLAKERKQEERYVNFLFWR